jgi:ABC-type nickel/cobalt efflux system permease component RcnA
MLGISAAFQPSQTGQELIVGAAKLGAFVGAWSGWRVCGSATHVRSHQPADDHHAMLCCTTTHTHTYTHTHTQAPGWAA